MCEHCLVSVYIDAHVHYSGKHGTVHRQTALHTRSNRLTVYRSMSLRILSAAAQLTCNTPRTKTVCFVSKSEHVARKLTVYEMGSWVGGIFDRATCVCYLHVFYY